MIRYLNNFNAFLIEGIYHTCQSKPSPHFPYQRNKKVKSQNHSSCAKIFICIYRKVCTIMVHFILDFISYFIFKNTVSHNLQYWWMMHFSSTKVYFKNPKNKQDKKVFLDLKKKITTSLPLKNSFIKVLFLISFPFLWIIKKVIMKVTPKLRLPELSCKTLNDILSISKSYMQLPFSFIIWKKFFVYKEKSRPETEEKSDTFIALTWWHQSIHEEHLSWIFLNCP